MCLSMWVVMLANQIEQSLSNKVIAMITSFTSVSNSASEKYFACKFANVVKKHTSVRHTCKGRKSFGRKTQILYKVVLKKTLLKYTSEYAILCQHVHMCVFVWLDENMCKTNAN